MEQTAPALKFVRLSDNARTPTKGSSMAAGYDLYAATDMTIQKGDRVVVPTDIMVAVPPGTYGRIAPRSGLTIKHFIDVGAGVVDADYRGPLGIVLTNNNCRPFRVKLHDRIAQFICEKIVYPELVEVDCLDTTDRGDGGFGSTK